MESSVLYHAPTGRRRRRDVHGVAPPSFRPTRRCQARDARRDSYRRELIQDDAVQGRSAAALLSTGNVYVPVTVVLELEWILRSRYALSASVISHAIEKLAVLENTVVGDADAIVVAARRMRQGWGFADALHHALSVGCEDFVIFDKRLARQAGRDKQINPAAPNIPQIRASHSGLTERPTASVAHHESHRT